MPKLVACFLLICLRPKILSWGVLVLIPLNGPSPVMGQQFGNNELIQRVHDEAPRAWEQQKREFARFFESSSGWALSLEAKNITEKWSLDIHRTMKGMRSDFGLMIEVNRIDGTENLYCANPQYAFQGRRRSGEKQWIVTELFRRRAESVESTDSLPSRNVEKYSEILAST